MGRRGRRLGPRRDAVPRARCARPGSPSRSRPSRRRRTAGRPSSRARTRRFPGTRRAELLAELVSLRRVDRRRGRAREDDDDRDDRLRPRSRPAATRACSSGAELPQLGGNARAGEGWLVVEGDESDRTVERLRPEIAVVTNVELDHHATFASEAEVEELFARWLAQVPHVVRGWELEPVEFALAVPGEHNRLNAAAALAALELAGVPRAEAAEALGRFRGAARRFELAGEARGVAVYDDYAHHPTELAATIAAARELGPERVLVLFQPHLPSRTRHLARELGAALAAADAACVTEVYAAREEPSVSGRVVVDALSEARPGMTIGWAPELEDAARIVAGLGARRRPRARRPAPATSTVPCRCSWRRSREDRGRRLALEASRRSARAGRRAPSRGRRTSAELEQALAWAGERGPPGRDDRARLEPPRRRRGRRRARAPARRRARRGRRRRASSCSPAAVRRTPSASTARARPGSAASSSPARSRARRAAASG